MRRSTIGHAVLLAALWLPVSPGNLFAAPRLEIRVLSGRPDMVSGGSALVQLTGSPPDSIRVMLNGRDVTPSFRPRRTAGALWGRIEGLKSGANVLEAVAGKSRATLS